MGLRAFTVNIIGLSNKPHEFHYEFSDEFFEYYSTGLISKGAFTADVTLDKRETLIEASFSIVGHANVICDRSLDPFDYPVEVRKRMMFKFGDANEELSDEIVMIHRDTDSLDLGQLIYEFIALAIPMKKLHPRYQEEPEDQSEGKLIYSSGENNFDPDSDEETDPRWDKLKKLK